MSLTLTSSFTSIFLKCANPVSTIYVISVEFCITSLSTAKMISAALISSHLDYCNSPLNNFAKSELAEVQLVQKYLARVVLRAPCFSPSLPLLRQLHWLPVTY